MGVFVVLLGVDGVVGVIMDVNAALSGVAFEGDHTLVAEDSLLVAVLEVEGMPADMRGGDTPAKVSGLASAAVPVIAPTDVLANFPADAPVDPKGRG